MRRYKKQIAMLLLVSFLSELIVPNVAFALTGGPSQPEVQSFEPITTTQMVDPFTGDFTYNIPLLDVEGYPLNISYHSGITMDQEASWVGLGWNLNPGAINRNLRGLPDDFSGDEITQQKYVKPDLTFGANFKYSNEFFGFGKYNEEGKNKHNRDTSVGTFKTKLSLNLGLGVKYNNYRGVSSNFSVGLSFFDNNNVLSSPITKKMGMGLKGGLNASLTNSTEDGLTSAINSQISTSIGKSPFSFGVNTSMQTNSIAGTKMNLGFGLNGSTKLKFKTGESYFSGGIGGSYSSFVGHTYIPTLNQDMSNYNISLSFKSGTSTQGLSSDMEFSGSFAGQFTKNNGAEVRAKGYGYYYQHEQIDNLGVLTDFNREKENSFSINNPNIPIPIVTNDLFSFSGQGTGGMFRTFRSDLGAFSDNDYESSSKGGLVGLGLNLGILAKNSLDLSVNWSKSKSGKWTHKLSNTFSFKGNSAETPLFEPSYFKVVGEKNLVDEAFYPFQDLDNPVAFKLQKTIVKKNGLDANVGVDVNDNFLMVQNANSSEKYEKAILNSQRTRRDIRNVHIGALTASQFQFCLNPNIENQNFGMTPSTILRNTSYRKNHHISQVTVQNPDGKKYVYGIPAYVSKQIEMSFTNAKRPNRSGAGPSANCSDGHVVYEHNKLGSRDRDFGGIDEYFEKTTTPAYTHSFLLTGLLSSDYIDNDNIMGPSENDHGTYTKFNYTKVNYMSESGNYRWRVPVLQNKANYNRGLYNDHFDDNANIIYGEKEMWYVSSIESKNMIAKFYVSERIDGLGVLGIHGGVDALQTLYKLDSILLFSKQDLNTVIKSVHFVYDYSLCKGVHNNVNYNPSNPDAANSGKLTLKTVYFKYNGTFKGKYNSYSFKYGFNPSYNLKGYDRWGNYKPNLVSDCDDPNLFSTSEFPYTEQDKEDADEFSAAWTISSIVLPSGGSIHVNYESDDYAYVQDKNALQMYKVLGVGNSAGAQPTNELIQGNLFNSMNNFIFIDLPSQNIQNTHFKNLISKMGEDVLFNFMMDLSSLQLNLENGRFNFDPVYEPVKGYAAFEDAGISYNTSLGRNVGWVKLKPDYVSDERENKLTNPIAKNAWQFTRMRLPYLINPGSNLMRSNDDPMEKVSSILKSITGFIPELLRIGVDANMRLKNAGFAAKFNISKSYIRLPNLTGFKYGGGCRVKKIQLSDNWKTMEPTSAAKSKVYGQEFDYTTTETVNGNQVIISSGVASYEPMIGNDENPFRQPKFYSEEKRNAPDDAFFVEGPFGESLFPSPVIGYSKISIKSIQPSSEVAVLGNKTGKIVHEFYTSKDFPTITKRTDIETLPVRPKWLWNLFFTKVVDKLYTSQGYLIKLNDMHGKPKATFNYSTDKIAFEGPEHAYSGVKYEYYTDAQGKCLSNKVQVVKPDGSISKGTIGVEAEVYSDSRQSESDSYSGGLNFNLDVTLPGPIPIPIPTGLPEFNAEFTDFKSVSIVKVVQTYGILKSTIAFENGASLSTENILFDAETGEVLLTKTQNEYDDHIYNSTYPAHWVYDAMGGAYKNSNLVVNIKPFPYSGTNYHSFKVQIGATLFNPADYLANGDLVEYNSSKYWVFKEEDGSYCLMNNLGVFVNFPNNSAVQINVIESGRKNMGSFPVAQVTSLNLPIVGNQLYHSQETKIINASASEFKDKWPLLSCYNPVTINRYYNDEAITIFKYIIRTGQISNLEDGYPGIYTAFNPYADSDSTFLKTNINKYLDSLSINKNVYHYQINIGDKIGAPNIKTVRITYGTLHDPIYKNQLLETDKARFNVDVELNFEVDSTRLETLRNLDFEQLNFTGPYIQFGTNKGFLLFDGNDSVEVDIDAYAYLQMLDERQSVAYQANPFLNGARNNWKMWRSWVYLENRGLSSDTLSTNIRKDGYYKTYSNFWTQSAGKWITYYPSKWQFTDEITKYHKNGNVSEKRNPLDQYSSVLYSVKTDLPVAVSQNAKFKHIISDNFEDVLDIDRHPVCPITSQYVYPYQFKDTNFAHTGSNSIVAGAIYSTPIIYENKVNDVSNYQFLMDTSDLYGGFSPEAGKYVISAWVKVDTSAQIFSYSGAGIKLTFRSPNSKDSIILKPKGKIIEGWQRIEQVFTIPDNLRFFNIEFLGEPTLPNSRTYFDDFRIHPVNAVMKSYVYDKQLRLISELDENNYATFYEYDDEGNLIRIKKETERGIITLKEVRSGFKKRNL
jgi:YD repeat-containing protein